LQPQLPSDWEHGAFVLVALIHGRRQICGLGDADLSNAIALNSTSFNAARMIGPAVAGLVIASVGTGWAFLFNGASFMGRPDVDVAAAHLGASPECPRPSHQGQRHTGIPLCLVPPRPQGHTGDAVPDRDLRFESRPWRSASSKPMRAALACCLDDGDRNDVGRAAGREPRAAAVHIADAGLCDLRTGCTLAALSPSYWLFAAALVVIGVAALTVTNTSNALMQLSTEPAMRGRVMALRLGIALGGTPIGAPIVGWLADHLGPGWALGVGAAAGFAAAIVAIAFLSQRDVEAGGCRQP
jgi:MFS family permease